MLRKSHCSPWIPEVAPRNVKLRQPKLPPKLLIPNGKFHKLVLPVIMLDYGTLFLSAEKILQGKLADFSDSGRLGAAS
jgi:hypothetical protein